MEDGDQIDAFLEQVRGAILCCGVYVLSPYYYARLEEGLGCGWNHNVVLFALCCFLMVYHTFPSLNAVVRVSRRVTATVTCRVGSESAPSR
jgi:hypothetical protein